MSTTASPHAAVVKPRAPAVSRGLLLRRKCACGGAAGASGVCETCAAKKRLQPRLAIGVSHDPHEREADRVADQVLAKPADAGMARGPVRIQRFSGQAAGTAATAPASVDTVLTSPGQPLETALRQDMEARFGHDFARVRVHTDAAAQRSAREVHAQAYTVGRDIVFGAGHYAPGSVSGRRLLAHELTHVLQQGAVLRRHAVSPEVRGPDDEARKLHAAEQRREDDAAAGGHGLSAQPVAGRLQRLPEDEPPSGGWAEKDEAARIRAEMPARMECMRNAPPDPDECAPARALTWADFTGTPDMRSAFGALTVSDLRARSANSARRACLPDPTGIPTKGVQAFFIPGRSWVKPMFTRTSNLAATGCNRVVNDCATAIRANPGSTWALNTTPSTECPASPTPRGDSASSVAECTSVVGKDCTDRAAAESARLLRHEQGHFDITCAIARKANNMAYTDAGFADLLKAARAMLQGLHDDYDAQTGNGCNAGAQATWEADIAQGLPKVTINVGGGGTP